MYPRLILLVDITSWVSIDTARAIFTFADWDGLPADPTWNGLYQNPCWNSLLAPEDPGFALLTNDEFYLTQHQTLTQYTARYRGYPNITKVRDALGPQRLPPSIFSVYSMASLTKSFGVTTIPTEWFGLLPGLPLVPLRKRNWHETTNSTEGSLERDIDGETPLVLNQNTENYNDEQSDEWIDEYMELARREESEKHYPTKPSETDAQPTPVGQGDPTRTAVSQGRSLAVVDLPEATPKLT